MASINIHRHDRCPRDEFAVRRDDPAADLNNFLRFFASPARRRQEEQQPRVGFVMDATYSSGQPLRPQSPPPSQCRGRQGGPVATLILVMSISLTARWVRLATPADAVPPVAASTVDRTRAAGTAGLASATGASRSQHGRGKPPARQPASEPLSRPGQPAAERRHGPAKLTGRLAVVSPSRSQSTTGRRWLSGRRLISSCSIGRNSCIGSRNRTADRSAGAIADASASLIRRLLASTLAWTAAR